MKEMAPDPEELHEMKLNEETYPLTEELFENDALIFDNTQIEEAWICHKDGTPYVGVKSEGFPSYGIWSVKTHRLSAWNHGWEDAIILDLIKKSLRSLELIR